MESLPPTIASNSGILTSEQAAASAPLWEMWVAKLYNLRQEKPTRREVLHKPIFLMSILDLLDGGKITENRIRLSDDLNKTFNMYSKVMQDDRPRIERPFQFLTSDGFWHIRSKISHDNERRVTSKSLSQIRERLECAEFDPAFWQLLQNASTRSKIREVLIARYFPTKREILNNLSTLSDTLSLQDLAWGDQELRTHQDIAFRNLILEIYDDRCCACGVRVVLEGSSISVAIRLIPFDVSHSDHPTNGIALCRNHHWAMEHHLIAPTPDKTKRNGVWRVSSRLATFDLGHRILVEVHGRELVPPGKSKFTPAPEALEWRADQFDRAERRVTSCCPERIAQGV